MRHNQDLIDIFAMNRPVDIYMSLLHVQNHPLDEGLTDQLDGIVDRALSREGLHSLRNAPDEFPID